MADSKNLCEEIETAIYSDTELTEEQKAHIENCENCRVLLSQVQQMKNDLGTLSVPGIAEGQITKSVMDSIKAQKVSKPFPTFKFTHHLGTVAAVAVILVAALIIKNPSEPDNESISTQDVKNGTETTTAFPDDAVFGVPEEDETSDEEFSLLSDSDVNYADTQADTEAETEQAPKIMMSKLAPKTENSTANAPSTEESINNTNGTFVTNGYTGTTDNTDGSDGISYRVSADDLSKEDGIWVVYSDVYNDTEESINTPTSSGGSAGGGGGTVNVEENETVSEAESSNAVCIFEGVEFLSGDENFDYNISLANQRLSELFGSEYRLSKEKLQKKGFDNDRLITLSRMITFTMFETFKNTYDIFE